MIALGSATEHKWREIIDRQRAGGLTVAAFCRKNQVAASSFFAWKRKLGGRSAAFVEAAILDTPPAASAMIEVRLRGGRRVRVGRGFDRDLLAAVVAALEAMA